MTDEVALSVVPEARLQVPGELQPLLTAHTQELRSLVQRSVQDLVRIGTLLREVKAALPRGAFGPWLKQEFTWSQDTAENFMRVAEFAQAHPELDLPQLGQYMTQAALYQLTAPSFPPEARAVVLDEARQGQWVDRERVQAVRDALSTVESVLPGPPDISQALVAAPEVCAAAAMPAADDLLSADSGAGGGSEPQAAASYLDDALLAAEYERCWQQVRLIAGDCRQVVATFPPQSVHQIIGSPPYWSKRDYGVPPTAWGGQADCVHSWDEATTDRPEPERTVDGQQPRPQALVRCITCGAVLCVLGLEPSLDCSRAGQADRCGACFICHLVDVYRAAYPVLRDDGTAWIVIGDTYAGSWGAYAPGGIRATQRPQTVEGTRWERRASSDTTLCPPSARPPNGLKEKDLCMVPSRLALALQQDGWYLRMFVPWFKWNGLPESVTDRVASNHEFLIVVSKHERYVYDREAVRKPPSAATLQRLHQPGFWQQHGGVKDYGTGHRSIRATLEHLADNPGRHRRSTDWMREGIEATIEALRAQADELEQVVQTGGLLHDADGSPLGIFANTHGFPGAHFATYPEKLVQPCVRAGSTPYVCSTCGRPWRRVGPRDLHTLTTGSHAPEDVRDWTPVCGCGRGLTDDDLEIIQSPTGEGHVDDPTLLVGRAGFARFRQDGEGRRPITRWEQRQYARQLKASPHRAAMADEAGLSFAHYVRTDRSAARPIPPQLLEAWCTRGWLTPVVLPVGESPPPARAVVLDLFNGSGTTGAVALQEERAYWGIDQNPDYVTMTVQRLDAVIRSMVQRRFKHMVRQQQMLGAPEAPTTTEEVE